jgi:predicted TIM-barrel fold metal-dependent hydrolase
MSSADRSGFRILDAHNHVGNLAASIGYSDKPAIAADEFADVELRHRLETLDERGVQEAIVIGGHSYLRPNGLADTRAVNNALAEYRAATPDRFPAAVGIVEPLYGDAGLDEIDRCARELGLAGISFHARFQGVTNASPWIRRYLARMAELGLVPFIHALGESSSEALWMVEALADAFADTRIVILDAFSTFAQSQLVPEVAARHPNLLFDTALSHSRSAFIPLIERFGADRLAYGSNLYSWPFDVSSHHVLPQILSLDITDDEKAAILGGNLRSALRLATPP